MTRRPRLAAVVAFAALAPGGAAAQLPSERIVGEIVPRDVREMYDRGLKYLVERQADNGSWPGNQEGPGVTGLCLMCFLASGDDPNFGVYSNVVRKAVRNIISMQDANTGYFGGSMYHHGFATLALAEAYGAVDERTLWPQGETAVPSERRRSIGQALELAVRAAVTSQKKNQFGAWRYSPDSTDADTSVSGAVLVGLLAARNAGIEVPDEAIERGVAYYRSMTSNSGQVAYSGMGFDDSPARIAIGGTIYAYARRKDLPQYEAVLNHLTQNLEAQPGPYLEYARYYQAQALFQGDVEAWEKWNKLLIRTLKESQQADGSFQGQFGAELGTSMSLLALALNYRFLPIYER